MAIPERPGESEEGYNNIRTYRTMSDRMQPLDPRLGPSGEAFLPNIDSEPFQGRKKLTSRLITAARFIMEAAGVEVER